MHWVLLLTYNTIQSVLDTFKALSMSTNQERPHRTFLGVRTPLGLLPKLKDFTRICRVLGFHSAG